MATQLTPEAQAQKDKHNREVEQRIACENTVIRSFVHHILAAPGGYTLSLYDGEEWTIKRSRDKEAIIAAMRTTDEDTLRVRRADGTNVGVVWFIYGNAGYEVAADWTDSEEFNRLIEQPLKTMENQEH